MQLIKIKNAMVLDFLEWALKNTKTNYQMFAHVTSSSLRVMTRVTSPRRREAAAWRRETAGAMSASTFTTKQLSKERS